MRKLIFFIFISIFLINLHCQQGSDLLKQANEKFSYNMVDDALNLYKASIAQYPSEYKIYQNIGFIYELKQNYNQAIDFYKKGLNITYDKKDLFYVNIGNCYYILNDFTNAEMNFSNAINFNGSNSEARYHRAQTNVASGHYDNAIEDYEIFLTMEPTTNKRETIEKLIQMLKNEKLEEERRRLAEEQRKRDEEEKQRALLQSVLDSLNDVSGDTENISAGTEEIKKIDVEIDLAD